MTNKKQKKQYKPVKNKFLIGQKVVLDGRLAGKINSKDVARNEEPLCSYGEVVQIFKPFTSDLIGYMVEIDGGDKAPTLPETSIFIDRKAFEADIIKRDLEVLATLKKKYAGSIDFFNSCK